MQLKWKQPRSSLTLQSCPFLSKVSLYVPVCVCALRPTLRHTHKYNTIHTKSCPNRRTHACSPQMVLVRLGDGVCDNTAVCSSAKTGQSSRAWLHVSLVQVMACHSALPDAVSLYLPSLVSLWGSLTMNFLNMCVYMCVRGRGFFLLYINLCVTFVWNKETVKQMWVYQTKTGGSVDLSRLPQHNSLSYYTGPFTCSCN